jgi:hypothetical protein
MKKINAGYATAESGCELTASQTNNTGAIHSATIFILSNMSSN